MAKLQKDYTIPFAVHLNIIDQIYETGKLKNKQWILDELETLNTNYKKENVSIKGLNSLIADLKDNNIEVKIRGDTFAKECVSKIRMPL